MAMRIADYALIGDCETGALIGVDGSIDWLCWPRFDSPACFAALLGSADNGRWLLAPSNHVVTRNRSYRPGTLILDTRIETESGAVLITEFMPLRKDSSDIVRIVTGIRGEVPMSMELTLRFDYGRSIPWINRMKDGGLRAVAGPQMAFLYASTKFEDRNDATTSDFLVSEGESQSFVLTCCESHRPSPKSVGAQMALKDTTEFWIKWSQTCSVEGEWRNVALRSLITLKAMTYRPTGGIVAALTTSLPEKIGGKRNWDYRYCWLRDATFTLLALMNCGYYEEAKAWRSWLLRATAGSPSQIQVMYGLSGERDMPERTLSWLPGYESSQPVRVGNAAADQLQLDVFGEIADALHHARNGRLQPSEDAWELERALVEHLETIWQQEDHGIWEFRGRRRHFTHSKVMAWVAFDRAVKAIEMWGVDGPVAKWRATRERIHDQVCERGWNKDLDSFVQSYDSDLLDASLLLLPLVGFLPANDPRILSTVTAVQKHLSVDGLLLRYDTKSAGDALPSGEGAFLPCTFWLADNLALQGRHEEARDLFTKLLSVCNDVGLLGEEYDPVAHSMLGNFPQAFTHVALINTALNLTRANGPAQQRGNARNK